MTTSYASMATIRDLLTRGGNPNRDNHGRFTSGSKGDITSENQGKFKSLIARASKGVNGVVRQCSTCTRMNNGPLKGKRIGRVVRLSNWSHGDCPNCSKKKVAAYMQSQGYSKKDIAAKMAEMDTHLSVTPHEEDRVRYPELTRNYEYTDSHGNIHLVIQDSQGRWVANQVLNEHHSESDIAERDHFIKGLNLKAEYLKHEALLSDPKFYGNHTMEMNANDAYNEYLRHIGGEEYKRSIKTERELSRALGVEEDTKVNGKYETFRETKARLSNVLGLRAAQDPGPEWDSLLPAWKDHSDAAQIGEYPLNSVEAASHLIHAWAQGNESSHGLWEVIQHAVSHEFGLTGTHGLPDPPETAKAMIPGVRVFVRKMYDYTQEWFAKQGITEVPLYRGMSFDQELSHIPSDGIMQEATIQSLPMSSFSVTPDVARQFALGYTAYRSEHSVVIGTRIPVKDILSTAVTGFGCRHEGEMTVLGRYRTVKMIGIKIGIRPMTHHSLNGRRLYNLTTSVMERTQMAGIVINIDGEPHNRDWIRSKGDPAYDDTPIKRYAGQIAIHGADGRIITNESAGTAVGKVPGLAKVASGKSGKKSIEDVSPKERVRLTKAISKATKELKTLKIQHDTYEHDLGLLEEHFQEHATKPPVMAHYAAMMEALKTQIDDKATQLKDLRSQLPRNKRMTDELKTFREGEKGKLKTEIKVAKAAIRKLHSESRKTGKPIDVPTLRDHQKKLTDLFNKQEAMKGVSTKQWQTWQETGTSPIRQALVALQYIRLRLSGYTRSFEDVQWSEEMHPRTANGRFAQGASKEGKPIGGEGFKAERELHHIAAMRTANRNDRSAAWGSHQGYGQVQSRVNQLETEAKMGASNLSPRDVTELKSLYRVYLDYLAHPTKLPQQSKDRLYQETDVIGKYLERHGIPVTGKSGGRLTGNMKDPSTELGSLYAVVGQRIEVERGLTRSQSLLQRLSNIRTQLPDVTRLYGFETFDEAQHPRGANGRFIGGDGLKTEANYHLAVRDWAKHRDIALNIRFGYGGPHAITIPPNLSYSAGQKLRSKAANDYLANTATVNGHVGKAAITAHIADLKNQADAAARTATNTHTSELQALYHIYDHRTYHTDHPLQTDPLHTSPKEYERLTNDLHLISAYKSRIVKVRNADYKAGITGKPVPISFGEKAGKAAEANLPSVDHTRIHKFLDSKNVAYNKANQAQMQQHQAQMNSLRQQQQALWDSRLTILQQPKTTSNIDPGTKNTMGKKKTARSFDQIRNLPVIQKMASGVIGPNVGNSNIWPQPPKDPRGDPLLAELNADLGFDNLPHIVTPAEMNQHIAAGAKELWRGVGHAPRGPDFVEGPFYAGFGVHGNGTYVAYTGAITNRNYGTQKNRDGMDHALDYTRAGVVQFKNMSSLSTVPGHEDMDPGVMMRMVLKPDARIVTTTSMEKRVKSLATKLSSFKDDEKQKIYTSTHTTAQKQAKLDQLDKEIEAMQRLLQDEGRYAAALGYDAIDTTDRAQMVLLNRTALRIQSRLYNPLTIKQDYAVDKTL